MKCKYCNGTGTTNWCVNGTFVDCPYCGGTGEIEQTNEEWFDDLSTEEKAKWIATQCGNAVMESTYDVSKLRKKRYWVEWLKQPHTNKE